MNTQEMIETIRSNYPPENYSMLREALDHCLALLEAEAEGRLLILPCKVGDTVYRINYISQNEIGVARYVVGISETKFRLLLLDEYGKTVFLTREEAEAALKNGNKP